LKLVALLVGGILFLAVVPWLFLLLGGIVTRHTGVTVPHSWETVITLPSLAVGVFFLVWSLYTHWFIGEGTPAPFAPSQKLIIKGPYRLCRNPIQLGAMFFYLGLLTYLDTLITGLLSFFVAFALGSSYYKFIEEKVLYANFGDDYESYRKRTPFLIPKLFH
jgi:protein-S-isoprenylcysteine O-methyltransferase Ste14